MIFSVDPGEIIDILLLSFTFIKLVADTVPAKAEGADTADNALNPLTVADVADTLVLNADVELRSVNLADTPLIAAELTFVAALIFVADIVGANAEGADTEDKALKPLTVAEVADTLVTKAEVELKSVNRADTPLMAAEDTAVAALRLVADIVGAKADVPLIVTAKDEVELKLVNRPDTPLIAAELTFVSALIFVADMFNINAEGADTADNALSPLAIPDVPDNVTP